MKKTFVILMVVVYVILSMGMTIIVHTCGGESKAIIAVDNVKDPCSCGDEMSTDMCCTTEIKTVKIDDDQLSVVTPDAIKLFVVDILPLESFSLNTNRYSEFIPCFFSDTSPPLSNDLTVSNCVFLI